MLTQDVVLTRTPCSCLILVQFRPPLYGAIITEESSLNVYDDNYEPLITEDEERYFVPEDYTEDMSTPTKISELSDIALADLLANPDDIRVTFYANYAGLDDSEKNVNGTLTDVIRLVQRATDFDILLTDINYDPLTNTVTDVRIIGQIASVNTSNQIYNRADFAQSGVGNDGNSFVMTNGATFINGQLLNVKLRL